MQAAITYIATYNLYTYYIIYSYTYLPHLHYEVLGLVGILVSPLPGRPRPNQLYMYTCSISIVQYECRGKHNVHVVWVYMHRQGATAI